MSLWDEAKHKRFHGKFASMGLNVKDLKRKHGIATVKQPGQGTYHVYHAHTPIGHIKPNRDGSYEARVMRKPGTVEKVSDHSFRSRAEAAAAIAAVHPAVKTINHEPLGDRRAKAKGSVPEKVQGGPRPSGHGAEASSYYRTPGSRRHAGYR